MKKALIVVDYQNDFVDGALGFKGAEKMEKPIVKRIEQAIEDGWDLLFTLDVHDADYLKTAEGKHIAAHCFRESEGAKLYGSVINYISKAKAVFEKQTYGSLELGNFLRQQSYAALELAGLVSNICVLSNAVIARTALPEAEIYLNRELTSGPDAELHRKALDVMKGLHIDIVGGDMS